MKSGLLRFCVAILSIIVFVTIAIGLENYTAIPFAFTFRVACAFICLYFVAQVGADYPGERWPKVTFLIALVFNACLFFSPLAHLPASKGDILLFALPNTAIFLAARAITYPVSNDHQRAVRQQMIVGLILALAFCAIILSIMLIPTPGAG